MYLNEKKSEASNRPENIPSFVELHRNSLSFPNEKFAENKKQRNVSLSRILTIFIVIILLLSVLFFGSKVYGMINLYSSFQGIGTSCQKLKNDFSNKDFLNIDKSLTECQEEIIKTDIKLTKINSSSFNVFSGTTKPLGELLHVLYNLTEDFGRLSSSVSQLTDVFSNGEIKNEQSFNFLFQDISEFLEINTQLQQHSDELKLALNQDNLIIRYLKKKLENQLFSLDDLEGMIDENVSYLEIFQKILGYDHQKRYLLLFQNSSELRPTGGFWGSYGILEINNGEITNLFTDDIYHLDVNLIGKENTPTPPAPLVKYLDARQWFMRDANWSPHFPDAANLAQYFYHLESSDEQKFDGVMAITPQLIEDLLVLLGPIQLDDLYFDRENFLSQLQYEVEIGYLKKDVPSWDRKEILDQLANKLLANLKSSLSWETIQQIGEILNNSLKKKDILLYFNDPSLQEHIISHQWGGNILNSEGDYLNIIDANLASFKTDFFIERKVDYQLERREKDNDDYDLIAKLEIKYLHRGNFDWKTTRYRTYTRIYVPYGSVLINSSGAMENDRSSIPGKVDVYDELTKTVFGAFIAIEPQKGGTLTFEYILPQTIKDSLALGQYDLILQKQPGVDNKTLRLNLDFGKEVKQISQLENGYALVNNQLIIEDFGWQKDYKLQVEF